MKYRFNVGDLVDSRKEAWGLGVVKATTPVHNEALVHFQNGKCRWVAVFALEKL